MQDFILAKRDQIAEICRKHHVRRLSVFGSAVRNDFEPTISDVDVVVEFDEIGSDIYFDNKSSLLTALGDIFGRRVDLLTWKSIENPYLLRQVRCTQEQLYAA